MSTAAHDRSSLDNPFQILGLAGDADEAALRARYLELVRENPPEKKPERFRQIHAAYQIASDPLKFAVHLLTQPEEDDFLSWSEIIQFERTNPPRLHTDVLFSLGNRDKEPS